MPLGLGVGELIVLIIILVVLFKPDRVKDVARNLGEAFREFNKSVREEAEKVKKSVEQ